MRMLQKPIFGVGLFVAAFLPSAAQAALFHVEISTFGAPVTEAVMTFDLLNDPTSAHHVAITNFYTNGSLLVCEGGPPQGPDACNYPPFVNTSPQYDPANADITGQLPSTVTIYDTPIGGADLSPITYFQNLLLDLSVNGTIQFDFEMAGDPGSDAYPDGFALSLFDASGNPILVPEDSGATYLFRYDFVSVPSCTVFSSATSCTEVQDANGVPEPGVLALALAGLIAVRLSVSARARTQGPPNRVTA